MIRKTIKFKQRTENIRYGNSFEAKYICYTYWFLFIPIYYSEHYYGEGKQ